MSPEKRLLLFAPVTGSDAHLEANLHRLGLLRDGAVEVLLIGRSSRADALAAAARACCAAGLRCHLLAHPAAHGPGADHKVALQLALDRGFATVAPVDGEEGFSAPAVQGLAAALLDGAADAAFGAPDGGSRAGRWTIDGGLARLQERLVGVSLSELRPRYRAYAVEALRRVRFDLASDGHRFDTDLLIQLQRSGARLIEVPVPAAPRRRRPPGTWAACRSLFRAWLCEKDLFYDRRFDRTTGRTHDVYRLKVSFDSSHQAALARVREGARVLDLGCGNPALAHCFAERRGCRVTGVDRRPTLDRTGLEAFHVHDLDRWPLPVSPGEFDDVLLLDVLEHLASPETFVDHLREELADHPDTRLIVSVPNVAFFVERAMLLLGYFHYGRRGILDLTHTRLFTAGSIRRLFEQSGFVVDEVHGIPAPYPLAIGDNLASRLLLRLNRLLIRLSLGLFSYQVMLVARALPSPRYLLDRAAGAAGEHAREPGTAPASADYLATHPAAPQR